MPTLDDKKVRGQKHNIILEQREKLYMTGVLDVVSFDEQIIVAETEFGVLFIKGADLHVVKLNLDNGELDVDGTVESLEYEPSGGFSKNKGSFFTKIFK